MPAKQCDPGSHRQLRKAYCVELNEIVNILDARRKFADRADRAIARFNFLCWSKACKGHDVRIAGVLYQIAPEEAHLHKAAHFRVLDPHSAGCNWLGATSDVEDDAGQQYPPEIDDIDEPGTPRRTLPKESSLVTVFDPRSSADQATPPSGNRPPPAAPDGNGDDVPVHGTQPGGGDDHSETRTSDLSILVGSYLDARDRLTPEEFREKRLRVIGVGTLRWPDYFVHLSHATLRTRDRVLFGGAKYLRRYGTAGFKFEFFDEIQGKTVNFYAASSDVTAYRYRGALESRVEEARKRRYVTIYATGRLAEDVSRGTIDLVPPDLDHVEIILGPIKGDSTAQDVASEEPEELT